MSGSETLKIMEDKMKKLFLLMLSTVVIASAAAFAETDNKCCDMQGGGMNAGGKECKMMGDKPMAMHGEMHGDGLANAGRYLMFKDELNLTAEQSKAIEDTLMAHKKDMIKAKADLQIAKLEMAELMKSDNPDFAKAREKAKEISKQEEAMKISMLNSAEKAYSVLTPEQKKKLADLKETRKANMKEQRTEKMQKMKGMK